MGSGDCFNDQNNPQVVVRVGEEDSCGVVEITDIMFKTRGPGTDFYSINTKKILTGILFLVSRGCYYRRVEHS